MLWVCFYAGSPGHLVQMLGIMDSIKYQRQKNKIKSKPDNPEQTSKSTQNGSHKWNEMHKMKLLPWSSQSSDLNPIEISGANWREAAPTWSSEGSGVIMYEGMVSGPMKFMKFTRTFKLKYKSKLSNFLKLRITLTQLFKTAGDISQVVRCSQ